MGFFSRSRIRGRPAHRRMDAMAKVKKMVDKQLFDATKNDPRAIPRLIKKF